MCYILVRNFTVFAQGFETCSFDGGGGGGSSLKYFQIKDSVEYWKNRSFFTKLSTIGFEFNTLLSVDEMEKKTD